LPFLTFFFIFCATADFGTERGVSLPHQDSQEPSELLRMLVSVFSGVLFGLVFSKLRAPTHNPDTSINTTNPARNETAYRQDVSNPAGRVDIPTVASPNRPPTTTQTNSNEQEGPKRGGHLVQWLIFFATAFYAGVALYQWRTQISALRTDQRAWVTVDEVTPTRQKDGSYIIRVAFKNTGKTPATNFTVKAVGDPIPRGSAPSAIEGNLPGIGIIAPEGFYHSNMPISRDYDWKTNDLFIHGMVEYKTVFKGTHWTRFCYHPIVTNDTREISGFAPCDFWNEVDLNEP
jgi:hypothetical protein